MNSMDKIEQIKYLKEKSFNINKRMLEMCIGAGKGHVTSCLSCTDILVALYYGDILNCNKNNIKDSTRDRFILSKGQASPILYTILADCGFFSKEDLNNFGKENGKFAVHVQNTIFGIEIAAGSLGQGYGVAAGIALSAKMNRELFMTYAVLGDGECYEGSIWETAMFVSHNNLNNLVTIVDRNYLCVTEFTENLLELEPFDDKWKAFGFNVFHINGHNFNELLDTISPLKNRKFKKPTVIICDTEKGKNVPSLCYNPLWHGIAPKKEQLNSILIELENSYGN